jgi:hypothetical protein
MNSVIFQEVSPVAAPTRETNQIEFQVPANSNGLIDLAGSYISSGVELYNAVTGENFFHNPTSPTGYANTVSFKEFLGSTLWRDVKIYLNGVEVNDVHPQLSSMSSFYKRLLQDTGNNGEAQAYNLARFGSVSVQTDTAPGFVLIPNQTDAYVNGWKDSEGVNYHKGYKTGRYTQIPTTAEQSANLGSVRQNLILKGYREGNSSSNPFETITKLSDGIFNQKAFLPANVDIRIVLTLNTKQQVVYNNDELLQDITYGIVNSRLWVKRAFPTPSAMELFNRTLATAPLDYDIVMTKSTMRSIPAGASSINETNLLNGVLPDRVLIAFHDRGTLTTGFHNTDQYISSGYLGQATNNCITSLYVNANGRQYPQRQYDLGSVGVENKNIRWLRPYMDYVNTWSQMNDVFPNETPPISSSQWNANYRFFVVDLRDDGLNENGLATDLNNRGSIEVVATQVNDKPDKSVEPVEMFVMGIYNAKVIIDANRNVSKVGF